LLHCTSFQPCSNMGNTNSVASANNDGNNLQGLSIQELLQNLNAPTRLTTANNSGMSHVNYNNQHNNSINRGSEADNALHQAIIRAIASENSRVDASHTVNQRGMMDVVKSLLQRTTNASNGESTTVSDDARVRETLLALLPLLQGQTKDSRSHNNLATSVVASLPANMHVSVPPNSGFATTTSTTTTAIATFANPAAATVAAMSNSASLPPTIPHPGFAANSHSEASMGDLPAQLSVILDQLQEQQQIQAQQQPATFARAYANQITLQQKTELVENMIRLMSRSDANDGKSDKSINGMLGNGADGNNIGGSVHANTFNADTVGAVLASFLNPTSGSSSTLNSNMNNRMFGPNSQPPAMCHLGTSSHASQAWQDSLSTAGNARVVPCQAPQNALSSSNSAPGLTALQALLNQSTAAQQHATATQPDLSSRYATASGANDNDNNNLLRALQTLSSQGFTSQSIQQNNNHHQMLLALAQNLAPLANSSQTQPSMPSSLQSSLPPSLQSQQLHGQPAVAAIASHSHNPHILEPLLQQRLASQAATTAPTTIQAPVGDPTQGAALLLHLLQAAQNNPQQITNAHLQSQSTQQSLPIAAWPLAERLDSRESWSLPTIIVTVATPMTEEQAKVASNESTATANVMAHVQTDHSTASPTVAQVASGTSMPLDCADAEVYKDNLYASLYAKSGDAIVDQGQAAAAYSYTDDSKPSALIAAPAVSSNTNASANNDGKQANDTEAPLSLPKRFGVKFESFFGVNDHWPFPTKVYHMLYDIEKRNESHIISFTSSGKALAIHDVDVFVKQIVRRYFNHTTINSFKRQLYLYGFVRVVEYSLVDAYRHDNFCRDRPDLLPYFDTCLPPRAKKAKHKR
jgi:HSF-type DNA-binding